MKGLNFNLERASCLLLILILLFISLKKRWIFPLISGDWCWRRGLCCWKVIVAIILLTSTVKNTSQSYQQLYQGTWIKTVKHALKIDIDLKDYTLLCNGNLITVWTSFPEFPPFLFSIMTCWQNPRDISRSSIRPWSSGDTLHRQTNGRGFITSRVSVPAVEGPGYVTDVSAAQSHSMFDSSYQMHHLYHLKRIMGKGGEKIS